MSFKFIIFKNIFLQKNLRNICHNFTVVMNNVNIIDSLILGVTNVRCSLLQR